MGDFAYGSHLEAIANTPYLMVPPLNQMSTASPMSGGDTAYQSTPIQIPDSTFFEEAIDRSPVSIEAGFASNYIPSPTHCVGSNALGDHGTPHYMLSSPADDKRSDQWAFDRRQSQASTVFSETSTPTVPAPKPKKRGRKPKKQLKEQAGPGQEDELHDDDLSKYPRRRRILERKRRAATKCRLRKQDEASALASREQAMEDQNRYLSNCFDSLTAEIYHLKTELLRHTDCNCLLIQRYIADEAKKSVDCLLGCSSAFNQYGGSVSPEYIDSCGTSESSSGSSTIDSLNLHSPGSDGGPAVWASSFQHGIDQYHKTTMPTDRMMSVQPCPGMPLAECGQGLYINMGLQEHQVDDLSWDPRWDL